MGNYPVLTKNIGWTKKQLEMYLILFYSHKIRSVLTKRNILKVFHMFEDGLDIITYWKINDKRVISQIKRINSAQLFRLEEQELVEFIDFEIYNSSNNLKSNKISKELKEKYNYVLRADEFNYEYSEFCVKNPTNIPDLFFNDLVYTINCKLKFDEYLKDRVEK